MSGEEEQWKRQFTEFLEHNLSSETIMQMKAQKIRRFVVDLDQLRITHRNLVSALLERAIEVIPALTAALNDRVSYVISEETAAAARGAGNGGGGDDDDEDPKEKLRMQQKQLEVEEEEEEEKAEEEEDRTKTWSLGFAGSFGANNVKTKIIINNISNIVTLQQFFFKFICCIVRLFTHSLILSFFFSKVNPRTLRSSHLWGLICVEGMITKCSVKKQSAATKQQQQHIILIISFITNNNI